jgi:hypothetical protein
LIVGATTTLVEFNPVSALKKSIMAAQSGGLPAADVVAVLPHATAVSVRSDSSHDAERRITPRGTQGCNKVLLLGPLHSSIRVEES